MLYLNRTGYNGLYRENQSGDSMYRLGSTATRILSGNDKFVLQVLFWMTSTSTMMILHILLNVLPRKTSFISTLHTNQSQNR